MKLSTFIIKEEKSGPIRRMVLINEDGRIVGSGTPTHGNFSLEFSLMGEAILATRLGVRSNCYDLYKEGKRIGRFCDMDDFRSDIELVIDGINTHFNIFTNSSGNALKMMNGREEIAIVSKKRRIFKTEYGLAINTNKSVELILVSVLMHLFHKKNVKLNNLGMYE